MDVAALMRSEMAALGVLGVKACTIYTRRDDGGHRVTEMAQFGEETGELSLDWDFDPADLHPDVHVHRLLAAEDFVVLHVDKAQLDLLIEDSRQYDDEYVDELEETIEQHDISELWIGVCPAQSHRLAIDFDHEPDAGECRIVRRMAAAFDVAYRRFKDLERAEAQTREAKIQTALERIRRVTGEMKDPSDLIEVVKRIKIELDWLYENSVAEVGLMQEADEDRVQFWSIFDPDEVPDDLAQFGLLYPKNPDPAHPLVEQLQKSEGPYSVLHFDLEAMWQVHTSLAHYNPPEAEMLKAALEGGMQGGWSTVSEVQVGQLYFGWMAEPPEELASVQPRFAAVLSEAQRRAQELQLAKEMAREAQIEASLERIRRASSDMSEPSDLTQVVKQIKQELDDLYGGDVWEFTLMMEADEKNFRFWSIQDANVIPDTLEQFGVLFPKQPDPPHPMVDRWWNLKGTFAEFRNTLEEAWQVHASLAAYLPEEAELVKAILDSGSLAESWHTVTAINKGRMFLIWGAKPPKEMSSVQPRFAAVLSEAQRRAQELQLAKEMAREAQIEAALERVRSQAMGMRDSDELLDVVATIHREYSGLGMACGVFWHARYHEDHYEKALTAIDGSKVSTTMILPRDFSAVPALAKWERGTEPFGVFQFDAVQGGQYMEHMISKGRFLEVDPNAVTPDVVRDHEGITFVQARTSSGEIGYSLWGESVPEPEAEEILVRFARVFDLAHRRFEDLREAEAAAREAQIEASLERVRAAAMAMHESHQLSGVAQTVCQQLHELGVEHLLRASISTKDEDPGYFVWYGSTRDGEASYLPVRLSFDSYRDILGDEAIDSFEWPSHRRMVVYKKEMIPGIYRVFEEAGLSIPSSDATIGFEILYDYQSGFDGGTLNMAAAGVVSEESLQLLDRLAAVFGMAYTRFLDLKKAEAQARESQIALALERVRARAMAMQKSEELSDVSTTITEQLVELGLNIHHGYVFLFDENSDEVELHVTKAIHHPIERIRGKSVQIRLPRAGFENIFTDTTFLFNDDPDTPWVKTPVTPDIYPGWAEPLVPYFEAMGYTSEEYRSHLPDGFIQVDASMGSGVIGMGGTVEFSEEECDILSRFASEFRVAHTRFRDIQKAEAQALESQIEAALERVRASAMSMHSSDEISQVAEVMWEQMRDLGFPGLQRSMVTVVDEDPEYWWMYGSPFSGDSGFQGLRVPFDAHESFREVQGTESAGLRRYVIEFEGESLVRFLRAFKEAGWEYEGDMRIPRSFVVHSANHPQGMVGAITDGPISEVAFDVIERFARVFGLAFQRYSDLKKAEKDYEALLDEKSRTEKALSDLQATQKQLVEQEKLASLGSLTAGIAHEIKNPLNFVNNFAEVSTELMEELAEAVASGETEEAAMILDDLRDNATQIAKHGKRADSIVRSMMQHARGGASEQEAIVVNDFLEEYANLAWHGMRARDHGFQAEIKRDFDPSAGSLQVMPQELGRVVLNLLNNAFDAIKTQEGAAVTVGSRRSDEGVTITVADNGPGIPEDIRQKIFEPFFTTKATGEGTGLGLSLSYDIVTKGHGGTMTVDKSEAGGARFTIQLPT